MQMKQAIIFVLAIFCCCSKNMCRPVLVCYGCCYALERSIKYYIETNRVSNKNPTKNQGRTLVLWKDEQFLHRHWHPSCTSKPSDISGMRKVPIVITTIGTYPWSFENLIYSSLPFSGFAIIKY